MNFSKLEIKLLYVYENSLHECSVENLPSFYLGNLITNLFQSLFSGPSLYCQYIVNTDKHTVFQMLDRPLIPSPVLGA